jgi:NAD(P)H-dependent FMN reductase
MNKNDQGQIEKLRVLGIGSSMRIESYSTETLKVALEYAQRNGSDTKLIDLSNASLPFYNTQSNSEGVRHVSNLVEWADAFILATPDYHGSMAGSLKNFLDYFWSEFAGKVFGYIVASHEKGLTVMDQMRTTVRQCYGWSMPYGISVNSSEDFNKNRVITSKKLLHRLDIMSRDIVVYGRLIRDQFQKDLESGISNTFAAHYR